MRKDRKVFPRTGELLAAPVLAASGLALGAALVAVLGACGSHRGHGGDGDAGASGDACVGLQCNIPDCRARSKPDTAISGTVFAPNGTLPLYGINVYIPATDPGPLPSGAACARCSDPLPGNPIVQTISDETGHFSLLGIPAGDNIPVIITSGKWRKRLVLPHVDACTSRPLPPGDTTLPKNRTEGDMPQIAITTGMADSLECLIRKLGVADTEITTDQGGGRVHLYAGMLGKDRFKVGFPGGSGQRFSDAQTLWGSLDKMKHYDIVMFSCEGAPYAETKPQAAMDAVKAYADLGGRLFVSHWHNLWIEGSYDPGQPQRPAVWPAIATWTNNDQELAANSSSLIDEQANPKGQSFATWMMNVGGSAARGHIVLQDQPPDPQTHEVLSTGRSTCSAVDPARAERWVYLPDQGGGTQNFQFTTPNEAAEDQRCGKVVFSDMHVSGTSGDGDYPDSCGPGNQLTPQEKALSFMFFDIASCVGVLF
jgi:hypothetical protein